MYSRLIPALVMSLKVVSAPALYADGRALPQPELGTGVFPIGYPVLPAVPVAPPVAVALVPPVAVALVPPVAVALVPPVAFPVVPPVAFALVPPVAFAE